MPVYDTHVIVHLCVLKDFNECSIDTKELRNGIVEETMNVSWLQTGLRKDQIIKTNTVEEDSEKRVLGFRRSVIVGVDSVVQKSTLFRKSVRVIHTLTGVLKEGKRVDLDINQHFEEV